MKRIITIALFAMLASACGNNNLKERSDESTGITEDVSASDTLCFIRVGGKDTTTFSMAVDGSDVSGSLNWVPYEKDSRVGTWKGKKNGNIIKGTWYYMQEGMNDSLAIDFMLDGDKLRQKKTKFDETVGREVLDENSGYELVYDRTTCE